MNIRCPQCGSSRVFKDDRYRTLGTAAGAATEPSKSPRGRPAAGSERIRKQKIKSSSERSVLLRALRSFWVSEGGGRRPEVGTPKQEAGWLSVYSNETISGLVGR